MNNILKSHNLDPDRLSHAYIISGSVEDANRLAQAVAAAKVCSGRDRPCGHCSNCRKAEAGIHPDIGIIEPEKDKAYINVDQIRAIKADSAVLPNDADAKVYIIRPADAMNPPAQNALLKLLEEPPAYCSFILVAENAGSLLQTVRSRSVEVRVGETDEAEADHSETDRLLDVFTSGDNIAILSACFEVEKLARNDFQTLLSDMRLRASERLKEAAVSGDMKTAGRLNEILSILDKTDEYALFNVGVGHTVGLFLSSLVR
jgi:DNA polymerase III delta prime subunit